MNLRPKPNYKLIIYLDHLMDLLDYVYQNVIALGLGMVPIKLVAIALVWGLVEYIIASLVGAALYKEA